MQPQQFIPILLMVAFAGYAVFAMSRRKKALANIGPAMRLFFERTGYRYQEIPTQPLEAQVDLAQARITELYAGTRAFEQNLVRDYYGVAVYHSQYMGPAKDRKNVNVRSCDWRIRFAQPPRILWQIADASLDSLAKGVKEAFSNTKRVWSAAYPNRVQTGDPDIDKRFVVYAVDPNAARHVLATPGLRDLLLGCTEVDLCVRPDHVVFADPEQKNLTGAMGGVVGQMAAGYDFGKIFELTVPVHDKIAQLLALVARASQ
jgi:hypothetical protein